MGENTEAGIGVATVARHASVEYRTLHNWIKQGHIACDDPAPGSGNTRKLTAVQAEQAVRMARLVIAGLRPPVAARVSRSHRHTTLVLAALPDHGGTP